MFAWINIEFRRGLHRGAKQRYRLTFPPQCNLYCSLSRLGHKYILFFSYTAVSKVTANYMALYLKILSILKWGLWIIFENQDQIKCSMHEIISRVPITCLIFCLILCKLVSLHFSVVYWTFFTRFTTFCRWYAIHCLAKSLWKRDHQTSLCFWNIPFQI